MTIHITPSQVTPDQIQSIREMRSIGAFVKTIAVALSLRPGVVEAVCRQHHIPSPFHNGGHGHRVEPGFKTDEYDPSGIRKATMAHLNDILREHGYWKTWENYDIPPETAKPMRAYYSSSLSVCGSPATMCEEAAG